MRLERRGDGPAGRGWGYRRGLVDLDCGLVSGNGGRSGYTEETFSVVKERTKTTWRHNRSRVQRATVGNNDMVVLKKGIGRSHVHFILRRLYRHLRSIRQHCRANLGWSA